MIKITVASYNNQATEMPLSAVFGRNGGTLGRGDDNLLVLPDPKNLVSRTQACVHSDGARHTIVNMSVSNPILLNGKEIDYERETPIKPGDRIQVGLYLLNVEPHLIAVDGATALESGPSAAVMQQEAQAAAAANAVDGEALMKAFLHGAGLPNVAINWHMSPEFMEMIGKLLAVSIEGAFDLLASRADVKREVNADMTMVVVRNNNPLKFLDDSQTVLTQMLRKKMPGFMGPLEALDDAYADLKAHRDSVIAGMRGAVGEALHRLSPDTVAAKRKAGPLDSVMPAMRKAAMWDSYCEQHARMAQGVRKDFQGTFGKAFMNAYEKHVERVLDEGGERR